MVLEMSKPQKVFVYRNLTKNCWSVRDCSTSLVIEHRDFCVIVGAAFKVSAAGRERVRRSGHKSVHAGVEGWLVPGYEPALPFDEEVTYDPYKHMSFVRKASGRAVKSAAVVWMQYPKVFI